MLGVNFKVTKMCTMKKMYYGMEQTNLNNNVDIVFI